MTRINRRQFTLLAMAVPMAAHAAEPIQATLFKNPQCECCEGYAAYLRQNGFAVTVQVTNDLAGISRKAGVPEALEGCHATFAAGYLIEGHVPIETVRKLLSEQPELAAITLPGMPPGSPGMFGSKGAPFVVYAIPKDGGPPHVYDTV